MASQTATPARPFAEEAERGKQRGFSIVLGGPLFGLLRLGRLCDEEMGLVGRRILFFTLVTWAPLFALSAADRTLVGPDPGVAFLSDVDCHLRFLFVAPMLIFAEWFAHQRLRPLVDQFRDRALVRPDQAGRFAEARRDASRLCSSGVAEAILLVAVYALGVLVVWRRYVALPMESWYASNIAGAAHLSPAGLWFVFVSLPIVQFLLIRWYFRLLVWAQFLWRISRLDLDLDAIHPDRAGGLGFVGGSIDAFLPLAAAHGALFAGMVANRIFFSAARLTDYEVELFAGVVLLLFMVAAPLTVFAPQLARVRRNGLRAYGRLAQTYVRLFADKWLAGAAPTGEPLIGSSDIQSLADLANGFAVVDQMRIVPVSRRAIIWFVGATLLPVLPLVLTMTPVEKLVGRLVGLVL